MTKSATDQVLDGVLGGLAEYLGIESVIVRLLYLVLAIANPAIGVLAYIAMAVIMPGPGGRISGAVRSARSPAGGQPGQGSGAPAGSSDASAASAAEPHDVYAADDDDLYDGDEDDADDDEYTRPDRVHIIGAGLVALGVFLIIEKLVTLPNLSSFAWAAAIAVIGVWILLRGRRDR